MTARERGIPEPSGFNKEEDQMSKLNHDSQRDLDRRAHVGRACITLAGDTTWDELHEEDRETYAGDAVSDILTALFGPAGSWSGIAGSGRESITYDADADEKARAFLDHCLTSWQGDAEDYTRSED